MIAFAPNLTGFASVVRAAAVLLCAWFLLTAGHAVAQSQEARMDEILHADRNQTSSFAGKTFTSSTAVGGKQTRVKSFAFGNKRSVLGGDGKFRTKGFDSSRMDAFRTESYSAKASSVSQRNSFAQGDRTFGTKSMDVREVPAANKSALVRDYAPANTTYYGRGKRQDYLDDKTQSAKNLTIDQVRDILNKGPAVKPGTILEPVVPTVR